MYRCIWLGNRHTYAGSTADGVADAVSLVRFYEYDALYRLGNILKLSHIVTGNTFNRWFNDFQNNAAAFQLSNLATEITYGSTTIHYTFDANGNQISEGSSRSFEWDFGDRMRGFAEGTSVRAAYLYDAGGNRVKKIETKSTGNTEVSVFIDGGFEYIYEIDGSTKVQEMIPLL